MAPAAGPKFDYRWRGSATDPACRTLHALEHPGGLAGDFNWCPHILHLNPKYGARCAVQPKAGSLCTAAGAVWPIASHAAPDKPISVWTTSQSLAAGAGRAYHLCSIPRWPSVKSAGVIAGFAASRVQRPTPAWLGFQTRRSEAAAEAASEDREETLRSRRRAQMSDHGRRVLHRFAVAPGFAYRETSCHGGELDLLAHHLLRC